MAGFSFVLSESGEAQLDGALRVENAAEIKAKLLEMFEKKDHIVLMIGEDADADLSFFQIVCSAHRAAARMRKTFDVAFTGSSRVVRSSSSLGFLRTKGSVCNIGKDCVWVIGGDA